MRGTRTERYWNRRARENALFFVDNRVDYRDPDQESFWRGGEAALDEILSAVDLEVSASDVVVDIGCGVGRITRPLAARASRVVALDISAQMLARARALNPQLDNVEWLHGDGRSLTGVPDASADGCFSHVVFQHISDPRVTLEYVREMGRVLRPGGWAAFQVSTNPEAHLTGGSSGRLRALAGRGPRGQTHRAWLGSAVEIEALREAADAAALGIERLCDPGSQFTTVLARRRD